MALSDQIRSNVSMYRYLHQRRRDPEIRELERRVREHIDLPVIPDAPPRRGEVWAVMGVRNEADIIGATIAHLTEQDFDHILVVDNESTDGTLELLHELRAVYPLHVGVDRLAAHEQAEKITHLARRAAAAGAAWVVPVDADEFWTHPTATVGGHLRRSRFDVELAPMRNLYPVDDRASFSRAGEMRLDLCSSQWVKVAFRAHRAATVGNGNHKVVRGRNRNEASDLSVLHVPWRSREQFVAKLRNGKAAIDRSHAPVGAGFHWRTFGAMPDGELGRAWESIVAGKPVDGLGWSPVGPFTSASVQTAQAALTTAKGATVGFT